MSFAKPTWLKAGITLALLSNWILVASASEVRTLKNIEVVSFENTEQVRLEFDGKFSGEPLINFESGSMSLRFSSTHTAPALPLLTVTKDNPLIKAVRAVEFPDTHFVHLEILLQSPRTLMDHPKITHSGNYIILGFPNNFSATPSLSSTNVLTKEIEKRVKDDKSFPSTFSKESTDEQPSVLADGLLPSPEHDWGSTMLTLVLSLLFVLFLIYLIAFIYKRFFSSRFSSMQGNVRIRQVSSHHVGPKQKIIVFEMNERKFACGVTPTSINLIAELQDETDLEISHSIQTDENAKDFNIDQTGESSGIDTEQPFEQTKTNVPNNKNSKNNFDTSIELEGLEKDIFLKSNSENLKSLEESNNHNKGLKSTVRTHFSKTPTKTKIIPPGNPVLHDFASTLSERLKFLKPIK